MLRRQEEERKRIPMAPMFDMLDMYSFGSGDGYLDLEGDEFESIVIDTGMSTVKVKEQFKITIHFVQYHLYDTFIRGRCNSVSCSAGWHGW